jgi:hypothetical protein
MAPLWHSSTRCLGVMLRITEENSDRTRLDVQYVGPCRSARRMDSSYCAHQRLLYHQHTCCGATWDSVPVHQLPRPDWFCLFWKELAPFLIFLDPLTTSTQYITVCERSSGTDDSSQTWTSAPGTPVSPCTAADLQASPTGLQWG